MPGHFRIVAAGDSVMWGQGLADDQKFASLVREALVAELPDDLEVTLELLARSGARIGCLVDGRPQVVEHTEREQRIRDGWPEIPFHYPTVHEQLASIEEGETVDLLLLTGGANDVGISKALSAFGERTLVASLGDVFGGEPSGPQTGVDGPLAAASPNCDRRARDLLLHARTRCPNARIVYAGYYPGLSHRSDDLDLDVSSLLTQLVSFQTTGLIDPDTPAGHLVFFLKSLLGAEGDVLEVLGRLIDHDVHVKNQVQRFHRSLLYWLRRSVAEHNREIAGRPVLFAHPGFLDENAAYAPRSFVFEWGADDDDEVAARRGRLCPALFDEVGDRLGCQGANAAHPNAAGARQYARRILDQIRGDRARSVRRALLPEGGRVGREIRRHGIAEAARHPVRRHAISLRRHLLNVQLDTLRLRLDLEWEDTTPPGERPSGIVSSLCNLTVGLGGANAGRGLATFSRRVDVQVDLKGDRSIHAIRALELSISGLLGPHRPILKGVELEINGIPALKRSGLRGDLIRGFVVPEYPATS